MPPDDTKSSPVPGDKDTLSHMEAEIDAYGALIARNVSTGSMISPPLEEMQKSSPICPSNGNPEHYGPKNSILEYAGEAGMSQQPEQTAEGLELERLKKLALDRAAQLKDAIGECEALKVRLEELIMTPKAEEHALDEVNKTYEDRVNELEKIAHEQKAKLSSVEGIAWCRRSGTVLFLPRETATEERTTMEGELASLERELKDTRIKLRIAQKELQLERNAQRGCGGANEDGDEDVLAWFYEACTNVRITKIEVPETPRGDGVNILYACEASGLKFTLEKYVQNHTSVVKYIYKAEGAGEEGNGRDELGIFGQYFQFKASQLRMFLQQLNDMLEDVTEEEEGDMDV